MFPISTGTKPFRLFPNKPKRKAGKSIPRYSMSTTAVWTNIPMFIPTVSKRRQSRSRSRTTSSAKCKAASCWILKQRCIRVYRFGQSSRSAIGKSSLPPMPKLPNTIFIIPTISIFGMVKVWTVWQNLSPNPTANCRPKSTKNTVLATGCAIF